MKNSLVTNILISLENHPSKWRTDGKHKLRNSRVDTVIWAHRMLIVPLGHILLPRIELSLRERIRLGWAILKFEKDRQKQQSEEVVRKLGEDLLGLGDAKDEDVIYYTPQTLAQLVPMTYPPVMQGYQNLPPYMITSTVQNLGQGLGGSLGALGSGLNQSLGNPNNQNGNTP